MSKHSWETEIDLPIAQVWDLLSDHFADIYRMHPGVEKSSQVEGTPLSGVGQERICNFYDGNRVQERITAHEEGQLLEIAVIGGTMPVKNFTAAFNLAELTDNSTSVRMDIDITGKGFFKVMSLLMARKSEQLITKVLKGLEAHGQTGRLVCQGGELEAETQAA